MNSGLRQMDLNVAGVLELVHCDSGSAELGLIVSASWRRIGIGTALLMEAVAMSTQCLELRQLIAITGYDNVPARRLLRRCGSNAQVQTRALYAGRKCPLTLRRKSDSAPVPSS